MTMTEEKTQTLFEKEYEKARAKEKERRKMAEPFVEYWNDGKVTTWELAMELLRIEREVP